MSGVTLVGPCFTFTTLFLNKTLFSMFWLGMNKLLFMLPMVMRALRVTLALLW